ncbi:MAG: DUF1616 domain-containing protein [Dehalococcoidales bacterium]|nr:MAG: DUF1616 domain-containing protein [Dehalococcoidales bacterium]
MSVIIKDELIALNLVSILLLFCVLFLPDNPLRIIPGIPFVLFLPGYSLIAALYPRKTSINGRERVLWSIGLSVAIVPLISLSLNLIPPGIRLVPVAIGMASFIFIMSSVAWYRRRSLVEYERFSISFSLNTPSRWREAPNFDKTLYICLTLVILFSVGVMGYKITNPVPEERITELFILNVEGNAFDYPDRLKIGEEAKVVISITNSEHEEMSYRLEVKIDGELTNTIGDIKLEHGETLKKEITFGFSHSGVNQKVEFSLFRADETEPVVTPLYLWIDVLE